MKFLSCKNSLSNSIFSISCHNPHLNQWPITPAHRAKVGKVRLSLTAVGWFIRAVHTVVVTVTHPDTGNAALSDDTLELVGCTCHLSYINTQSQLVYTPLEHTSKRQAMHYDEGERDRYETIIQPTEQADDRRAMVEKRHSRQSFSSSPWPQLFWPLQRKIPGMQRLGCEHLNWLGRHTWMSTPHTHTHTPTQTC